jgi:acetyltransferase
VVGQTIFPCIAVIMPCRNNDRDDSHLILQLEKMMEHPLNAMLRPSSIAVVGASRSPGSLGNRFLRSLVTMGYSGCIYPVNPKAASVSGIPCVASVAALPAGIDLAVILLPHPLVPETLRQLGQKRVRHVVIVSAGFKEVGIDGLKREQEVLAIAHQYGIRLLGPNCMGVFNSDPAINMNASFSPVTPVSGNIAFISQSGALGVAAQDLSLRHRQGFSIFVSLGNKCDLDEADFLEFLEHDEQTKVVMLYLENIRRPEAFRVACRRLVRRKPVLVVKAGRGETGSRAASSHTGALASADATVDAFLRQCGAIRCDTMEGMLDISMGMSVMEIQRAGPRVAVVSGGGGPCILAADALEIAGLQVPPLTADTCRSLLQILPPEAGISNPVDMIASADHNTYAEVFKIIDRDPGIDTVMLVIVRPPGNTTIARIIETVTPALASSRKGAVAVLMCDRDESVGLPLFRQAGVPIYGFAEEAALALKAMVNYQAVQRDFSHRPALPPVCPLMAVRHDDHNKPHRQLPVVEVLKRLDAVGIAVPRYCLTADPLEAGRFAESLRCPVAVKNANEQIIHKSDAGLVKLGLAGSAAVCQAVTEMQALAVPLLPAGVSPLFLVQEMVSGFPELVAGIHRDPHFGPVLMLGLGGILVEALRDVSFRVAPLEPEDVDSMVAELRGGKLLDGVRHLPAVDRRQLADLMLALGRLANVSTDLLEMDLNPVIWDHATRRLVCVDARMTVTKVN